MQSASDPLRRAEETATHAERLTLRLGDREAVQSPDGLTVRPATARDIPALLRLLAQVNELHHQLWPELFLSGQTKYTADALLPMLGKPDAPILVAEDADGVCGYLIAFVRERIGPNLTGGRSFYIDDLCVDAACRGRGVGSRLLAEGRACAAALGCRELLLNVWEGNDAAQRFYARSGFLPRSHLLAQEL